MSVGAATLPVMSLKIVNITVNTHDPKELADWWVAALDGEITADYGDFVFTRMGAIGMGFQKTDESGPNRLHLDLAADDRQSEVRRLVGRGATRVADHEVPDITWTVMADPHGNRFCVSEGH